jgi:ankyrin repeat protein
MRTYHRERTVDLDVIKDFMSAAITDHAKARELLKDNPKLLDTNVTCGETPLHSHAISGHISALEFLAGEGFEVDSRNVFGDTPLMDAADMDELETAEVLLRLGADPNAESGNHDYALFRAIMYGNPKMVKLLLDHGASTNHTNCYGESVMDVAREIENNRSEIEQLLRQAMGQDSSD